MPTDRAEIEQIIDEKLKNYLADNRVDGGRVERDQLDFLISNKVDSRNVVDHVFTTTGEESFEHSLGRVPKGCIVLSATISRNITGDIETWDAKRAKMTSPSSGNRVRLLFL